VEGFAEKSFLARNGKPDPSLFFRSSFGHPTLETLISEQLQGLSPG